MPSAPTFAARPCHISVRMPAISPPYQGVQRAALGSFQGHVDLHGMLKDEAKTELESFLSRSRQQRKRCVLVVHGRGLHSKDQVPVLKEALKRWMHTARFARYVLAFSSSRPHDGGTGAIYVLLKKS